MAVLNYINCQANYCNQVGDQNETVSWSHSHSVKRLAREIYFNWVNFYNRLKEVNEGE